MCCFDCPLNRLRMYCEALFFVVVKSQESVPREYRNTHSENSKSELKNFQCWLLAQILSFLFIPVYFHANPASRTGAKTKGCGASECLASCSFANVGCSEAASRTYYKFGLFSFKKIKQRIKKITRSRRRVGAGAVQSFLFNVMTGQSHLERHDNYKEKGITIN